MIRNYLKIAFRTLFRYKGFSIIKIAGLALSISICLLIIMFINEQKSSDKAHKNHDRILRFFTTDKDIQFTEVKGWATTPGSLAPYLMDHYPFIEDVLRLRQCRTTAILKGEAMAVNGLYAEPSFFNIFSFRLLKGNSQNALNEPYKIVISEETAAKFFGKENPLNKIIKFENLGDFTVTGILKDMDKKSHVQFDALFSFPTISSLEKGGLLDSNMDDWSSFDTYYTYVLLRNKKNRSDLREYLPAIATAVFPDPEIRRFGFGLQPLLDINLGINLWYSLPGTRKSFDILFIPFLAILIIFIACFNYINLSIAGSLNRSREVGFRKVIGAKRDQIIWLFLSETIVITMLALITAILFIRWLIHYYNESDIIQNSGLQVNPQTLNDPLIYIYFILFAVVLGFIAGIFPALYLSSFQPINALKGVTRIKGISNLLSRKILMVIQFAVSLTIIIITVYSNRLFNYWTNFDYGIKTENLVYVYLQEVDYEQFRTELLKISNIDRVSLSDEIPIFGSQRVISIRNKTMEKPGTAFNYSVDPEFIENYKITLIAGRNFSNELPTDMEEAVIINEKAVEVFDLGWPVESIGTTLIVGDNREVSVIGVVKDFSFYAPDEPVRPLVLQYHPKEFRFATISYFPDQEEKIKDYLQETWLSFDKIHPINYQFMEDAREEAGKEGKGIITLFACTCGFIIFIALLGLLGMASYTTKVRIKEIGIRKVMGANVSNIVYLLSINYIKLILYSAAFAVPGGYILAELFYRSFAYRPALNLWVLPASVLFILVLAIFTVSSQTVKAAISNPSETLNVD